MCERNDLPGEDGASNLVYHRFKKKLIEANFEIKCKKCNENRGFVVLQKKDVFCGACLVDYCTHKFRATIGKSRLVKPGNRVLVAFSGGLTSVVMADLIRRGFEEDFHRRLRFVPSFLHIDESILSNQPEERILRKDLVEFLTDTKLDLLVISLESSLSSDPNWIKVEPSDQENLDEKLNQIHQFIDESHRDMGTIFLEAFNQLDSLTSKHDFVTRLRYRLMVAVAKKLAFDAIFVGTSTDELANGLMINISLGRGMETPAEMGFIDDRYVSVAVLRPMREFAAKEAAFYARYRGLSHLAYKPDWTITHTPLKSSIAKLTETFLTQITEEFPSTLYTVFKTGNKISSSTGGGNLRQRCRFCLGKIDFKSNDQSCTAFDALRLTSNLSVGNDEDLRATSDIDDQSFCYSCFRLKTEMGSTFFERFCTLSLNDDCSTS